jgi:hypothetical protein
MAMKIPPGCIGAFVDAPIYLTPAMFAMTPASANRGRTVYLLGTSKAYVSRSTGFDTWVWAEESSNVSGATGQTVGAVTSTLSSGTVLEGTSVTLFAVVTADRGGGLETASMLVFAGVRRAVAGLAVLVPGGSLEIAGVRDSLLPAPDWRAAFDVDAGSWRLRGTGSAGLTINWSADISIRSAP